MMNKSVIWRASRNQPESGWQRRSEPGADSAALDRMIGRRLKSCYADAQAQPLPQRLSELLHALDQADDPSDAPRRR